MILLLLTINDIIDFLLSSLWCIGPQSLSSTLTGQVPALYITIALLYCFNLNKSKPLSGRLTLTWGAVEDSETAAARIGWRHRFDETAGRVTVGVTTADVREKLIGCRRLPELHDFGEITQHGLGDNYWDSPANFNTEDICLWMAAIAKFYNKR